MTTDSTKIVPHRGATEKSPYTQVKLELGVGSRSGAWHRYNDRQEKLFQRFMSEIRSGDSERVNVAARAYREALQ